MEKLIEAFGIDTRLIIIQIINFGLLMVLLSYYLYKPVLKLLKEREEKIAKGIEDAIAAEAALANAEAEKKVIVTAANREAEAMASRAKEHATLKGDELLNEASRKVEQLLKDASIRGEELKAAALRESEAEIAKLAILAAEKVLKERTV